MNIRAGSYRDREGFYVRGYAVGAERGFWQPSCFTETRESAEHIKRKFLRGEHAEYADFFYPNQPPARS